VGNTTAPGAVVVVIVW